MALSAFTDKAHQPTESDLRSGVELGLKCETFVRLGVGDSGRNQEPALALKLTLTSYRSPESSCSCEG